MKLKRYYGNYGIVNAATDADFSDNDAWKVGVTVDYQIADNLYAKAAVNYLDGDKIDDIPRASSASSGHSN